MGNTQPHSLTAGTSLDKETRPGKGATFGTVKPVSPVARDGISSGNRPVFRSHADRTNCYPPLNQARTPLGRGACQASFLGGDALTH